MSFVGLDPVRAGELASHLDQAAADLEAHAQEVARLLAQAGVSSAAPAQLREVAGWAAYRSRDLRRRIDEIAAAGHVGAGPLPPGFRFASRDDAVRAAKDAAEKLRNLLAKHDKKGLGDELWAIEPYLVDPRFAGELFKRLGPKGTFDVLAATQGSPDVLAVGRSLAALHASGVITDKFLDGILEAARKRVAALDAYMHPWGSVRERDRAKVAQDEYVHGVGSPPGLYHFLESVAPLVPYLESGTKVAIIGGAVVILTAGAACIALSEGSCLGPAAAFAEEGAVIFSSEAPSVPTGLFETLPMSLQDEAKFTSFIDKFRAVLPRAQFAFRGSSATGVKWTTGEPFSEASDIDLAVVDADLFAKAQELGIKLRAGDSRTLPLTSLELEDLGLSALAEELSAIAGHPVKFMVYRSMDDILARGPAIVVAGA